MSSGLVEFFGPMCCICFAPLTIETAWKDADGQAWDLCATGTCAREAGALARR
jgi:hypothetical protein